MPGTGKDKKDKYEEHVRNFDTAEAFNAYYSQKDSLEKQILMTQSDPALIDSRSKQFKAKNLLEKNLYWTLNPDGTIPKDANGKSYMFLVRTDKDGKRYLAEYDGKQFADGTKLEYGSPEFWDQAMMGNVLVYEKGGFLPRQYRAYLSDGGTTDVGFTKPIRNADLAKLLMPPEPALPRRPGFFKRLIHRIIPAAFHVEFQSYDRDAHKYQAWHQEKKRVESKCETRLMIRSNVHEDEKKDVERQKEEKKKLERENKLKNLVENAKKLAKQTEVSEKFSMAIFEPVPKILKTADTEKEKDLEGRLVEPGEDTENVYDRLYKRDETVTNENGSKEITSKEGFFNLDSFKKVEVFNKEELDLNSIPLGNTGRSVSKSEFCSVAMFTAMDPDHAMKMWPDTPEYDPTLENGLKQLKDANGKRYLSDGQIKYVLTETFVSMYTTDTFRVPPRDTSGDTYMDKGILPARRTAKDAFNAYKAGDPQQLGKLLANAIEKQARHVVQKDNALGVEFSGECNASGHIIGLLDADPKLMEEARKAGMKQEDLLTVRGIHIAQQMNEQARKANVTLAEAAAGKPLSDAEKRKCVHDIVKAQVAYQTVTLQNGNTSCKTVDELQKLLFDNAAMKEKNNNKLPEGKLFWYGTSVLVYNSVRGLFTPKPVSAMLLTNGKYMDNLDKVADKIIEQDKLMEKDPETLVKTLAEGDTPTRGQQGMEIMTKENMLREPTEELSKQLGVELPENALNGPKKPEVQKIEKELEAPVKNEVLVGKP